MLFSFLLGFATTIAEPALIAIANKSARISVDSGLIVEAIKSEYAFGLRISVAMSVGIAILIGVVRIIKGWPVYYLIIGGYVLVMIMTIFAPNQIISIAYDAGGVTTSTVTVPVVAALGVGLSSSIDGRDPAIDGFGLIALVCMFPIITVLGYVQILEFIKKINRKSYDA